MADTVVLATSNRGKIAELEQNLKQFGMAVKGLHDFPGIGEIEENGASFAENALIKARAVARFSGMIAIADDSGLCVDALNGAPGIFSARYGEDLPPLPGESRDERNIRKLLSAMKNVKEEDRGCHFATAMAAVRPDGHEIVANGEWHGRLLSTPLGHNGFGYDPVFWDHTLGRSAAQLSREEKNSHSHRGKALAALLSAWPGFIAS